MNLPNNLGIEQSIIGALINNNDLYDQVSNLINEHDFFNQEYQKIFNSIKKKIEGGYVANIMTLAADFEKSGLDINEIKEIYSHTDIDIKSYAAILKDLSVRRKFIEIGNTMIKAAEVNNSILNELPMIEESIYQLNLRTVANDTLSFVELSKSFIQKTEELIKNPKAHGVQSGFNQLDKITGGFRRGELTIIAARPSVGKTAFAVNICLNAALEKKNILFISIEMPGEQICARILSSLSRLSLSSLLHATVQKDHIKYCADILKKYSNLPLFIQDSSFITIGNLQSILRQHKRKHNIQLVVIDYLQLIDPGTHFDSREQEISKISRSLKLIAKDLDLPVVALSQLSRDIEKRKENSSPKLSDLRGSGSIEQDADIIMFLYREKEDVKNLVNLYVAKNRNGALGEILLNFEGSITTFTENTENNSFNNHNM